MIDRLARDHTPPIGRRIGGQERGKLRIGGPPIPFGVEQLHAPRPLARSRDRGAIALPRRARAARRLGHAANIGRRHLLPIQRQEGEGRRRIFGGLGDRHGWPHHRLGLFGRGRILLLAPLRLGRALLLRLRLLPGLDVERHRHPVVHPFGFGLGGQREQREQQDSVQHQRKRHAARALPHSGPGYG